VTAAAHARAQLRHRRGLAFHAELAQQAQQARPSPPWVVEERVDELLDGGRFCVPVVRAYARELVALEVEHAVFTDWTMAQGLGPDNREPGAFGVWCGTDCDDPGSRLTCGGYCHEDTGDVRGGWPGMLAREWPGDRRAPQGRSLARVGMRLLEALEGQPDECQGCEGTKRQHWANVEPKLGGPWALAWVPGDARDVPARDCPDCHGTGHNLRGVLPEVEHSPQLRRRIREIYVYRSSNHGRCWLDTLDVHPGYGVTRVVPRGEHRCRNATEPGGWVGSRSRRIERVRVTGYREMRWAPQSSMPSDPRARARWASSRMPRWRRGELLHAQQRRERAEYDYTEREFAEWSRQARGVVASTA
jgi:hypothetical protein